MLDLVVGLVVHCLYYAFIYTFALSAIGNSPSKEFLGSWCSCDYFGQYSEIHISEEELIYNINFPNGWYDPHPYEITNDTLLFLDTLYNFRDSHGRFRIVKTQLAIDHVYMTVSTGNLDSILNTSTFNRIPFEIEEYYKNDSISYSEFLNKSFYSRSEIFRCQDKRTEEEQQLDSIEFNKILQGIF